MAKANIFNIQRFSLHDGPGIRTTVFFKGCNMACAWCHNPESFRKSAEISFDSEKCVLCGKCLEVCKNGAHSFDGEKHIFDKTKCVGCFACAEICPAKSLTVIGGVCDVRDVFAECMKDKKYYRNGGGVTFSGGEATLYPEFIIELSKLLHSENINVCLETNGYTESKIFEEIIPHIDLFLFDFKLYDDELHKKYTGVSNKRILENLDLLNRHNKPVILRMPIIPTVNDKKDHFDAAKAILVKYDNIIKHEIMPYHDIGKMKWKNLMKDYSLGEIKPPSAETLAKWNGWMSDEK